MALILNILLFCMATGIFAGRVYEMTNLIDIETGFLIVNGLIFNAYIIPIFLIITICCGILILGDVKGSKTFFAKSAGVFAVLSGVSFIGYVVANILVNTQDAIAQSSKFMLFIILGAIGLILLGSLGLKGKNYEAVTVILLLAFSTGLCLDAIIFNVSSIYNIDFLKNSLSTISISFFLLLVFKNVYSPSILSKMWLYISGMICFVLAGVMHLADIAYGFINSSIEPSELLLLTGYVLLGIYAALTSFFAIPNGKIETKIKDCEPAAYDSIKMLANTQEIKIEKKDLDMSDIAMHERENQFAKKFASLKTSVYQINGVYEDKTVQPQSKKEKRKAEKEIKTAEKAEKLERKKQAKVDTDNPEEYLEKPKKQAVKEKPEKKNKVKAKKSKGDGEKIVYKRSQD